MTRAWHLNEGLVPLNAALKTEFRGLEIGTIGDEEHQDEESDHNPNAAGRVNADDIMLGPAFTESDADALIPYLIGDRRTKYLIHDRLIWRDPTGHSRKESGWHAYTLSDPHTNHIHLSVWDSAHTSTGPWRIDMTPEDLLASDTIPNPYPSAKATNNPDITVRNALKAAASADAKADLALAKLDQVLKLLTK